MLPEDPQERKNIPIDSGFFKYFPDAIIEVTKQSMKGHLQHYDRTEPLQWDKSKSSDDPDAAARHRLDMIFAEQSGNIDEELEAAAAYAWRAMAICQKVADKKKELKNAKH